MSLSRKIVRGTDTIPNLVSKITGSFIPLKRDARTMKYPYTFAAKVAQFPYAYYWKTNMLYRYIIYTTILLYPLFYKLRKFSSSPENVKYWKERRQREWYGDGGHH